VSEADTGERKLPHGVRDVGVLDVPPIIGALVASADRVRIDHLAEQVRDLVGPHLPAGAFESHVKVLEGN